MAAVDVWMPRCLVVSSLSPWVSVNRYELRGHRHNAEVIAALPASAAAD